MATNKWPDVGRCPLQLSGCAADYLNGVVTDPELHDSRQVSVDLTLVQLTTPALLPLTQAMEVVRAAAFPWVT